MRTPSAKPWRAALIRYSQSRSISGPFAARLICASGAPPEQALIWPDVRFWRNSGHDLWRESAFTVAVGRKADIGFCTANVRLWRWSQLVDATLYPEEERWSVC